MILIAVFCPRLILRMRFSPSLFHRLSLVLTISCLLNSCTEAGLITPPQTSLGNALNTGASEENPRFSYDGRYLVYASDRNSRRAIYLYDTRELRLVPLPGLNQPGTFPDQPDISADGRYIVYMGERGGKTDIYVYDRQTFNSENITESIFTPVRRPSISGNGRFVAFESNRSGQWNIEIFDRGLDTPLSAPVEATSQPKKSGEP